MEQKQQCNYKIAFFIVLISSCLGYFVDQLLNINNYSFLISFFLPIIMVCAYYDYIVKSSEIIHSKWKHKLFTFIVFLFMIMSVYVLIEYLLNIIFFHIQNSNKYFLVISATTILISTFGDKILDKTYKCIGLTNALNHKELFFSQNDIKMFIYFIYFIFIVVANYGIKNEITQLCINTFATYVAFERFWKFWQERQKKG